MYELAGSGTITKLRTIKI